MCLSQPTRRVLVKQRPIAVVFTLLQRGVGTGWGRVAPVETLSRVGEA